VQPLFTYITENSFIYDIYEYQEIRQIIGVDLYVDDVTEVSFSFGGVWEYLMCL